MPLVTSPPVLIDPSNFSRQASTEINPMGPFRNGSNLYIVLCSATAVDGTWVYKSTNNGATWTKPDSVNAPTGFSFGHLVPYFDLATKIIYIWYEFGGGSPGTAIKAFDTNTDTYGAVGTTLATGGFWQGFNSATGELFYRTSTGIGVIVFVGSGTQDLYYRTYIAGVWSADILLLITGGASVALHIGTCDLSDAGHIFYSSATGLFYLRISALLVPGSSTTIHAFSGGESPNARGADILINGNSVAATLLYQTSMDNVVLATQGTPLSGPVFTNQIVLSLPFAVISIDYTALALSLVGNLTAFWSENDFSGTVDEIDMSTFDGVVWSAPTVFYNEITNPPASSDTQVNQFVHTLEVIQLSNGSWIAATAMELVISSVSYCAGMVLVSGSTVPLAPSCPIGGGLATVGVAYSGTIGVSGGTPPYTFSMPAPVSFLLWDAGFWDANVWGV